MPLTLFETVTIMLTVLACWFAMTRAANAPRQAWRAQAAALGVALISLGVGGTTWLFRSNLDGAIGMSPTTRHLVFEAGLAHAHRPMLISMIGLVMYTALLRSSASGDAHTGRATAEPLSWLMVLGAVATLVSAAVYTVRMATAGADDIATTLVMQWNLWFAMATFGVAVFGFLWGTVRAGSVAA